MLNPEKKFDMNILQVCPPHLSDVADLSINQSINQSIKTSMYLILGNSKKVVFSGYFPPKFTKIG